MLLCSLKNTMDLLLGPAWLNARLFPMVRLCVFHLSIVSFLPLSWSKLLELLYFRCFILVCYKSILYLLSIKCRINDKPKMRVSHLTCKFWFTLQFLNLTCIINFSIVTIDYLALSVFENAPILHHKLRALVS